MGSKLFIVTAFYVFLLLCSVCFIMATRSICSELLFLAAADRMWRLALWCHLLQPLRWSYHWFRWQGGGNTISRDLVVSLELYLAQTFEPAFAKKKKKGRSIEIWRAHWGPHVDTSDVLDGRLANGHLVTRLFFVWGFCTKCWLRWRAWA